MGYINELKSKMSEISKYQQVMSLMHWDLETGAPNNSFEYTSDTLGELSAQLYRMETSDEIGDLIEKLTTEEEFQKLEEDDKRIVKLVQKEYKRTKKLPEDFVKEFSKITSKAQKFWIDARKNNDFTIFQPYLEKIVKMSIQEAEYVGYKENKYDALLDIYEPGMTTKELKRIIGDLKIKLVDFVKELSSKGTKPKEDFLFEKYDVDKQKDLSLKALKLMNYNFDAGRLDIAAHPFTIKINPGDVRITTRYQEKDVRDSFFSTIHEGGHALYEQGISNKYSDTPLYDGASMGIHESQSRYWENILGRSYEFWKYFYPEMQNTFNQLKDIELDDFYRAINVVEKSLIRVDADEVTYNLHIMLRFEIEEALINEKIKVEDLPKIWNEKMKEYLDIVPENNSVGVLQDVHWSHGSFGYFPSYMLGNLFSAQFYSQMKKDIPNYNELVKSGNLKTILDWLRENIHKHGKKYEPNELLEKVTGEKLNPNYFMDYLKEKYSKVYKI
ncbi:MAG: carboxypeptidase M32 [Thermotogota bacterium]